MIAMETFLECAKTLILDVRFQFVLFVYHDLVKLVSDCDADNLAIVI